MFFDWTWGVKCGVVKWVDPAWSDILKNRLIKPWEMFHGQNLGRIQEMHAYEDELAKLMKEKVLGNVVIPKQFLRTRKIMVMHSNKRGEYVYVPS